MKGKSNKIIVGLGGGEMQEGQNAEAMMHAAELKLDNLVAIVDDNGYQIEGPTSNIGRAQVARGYGWNAIEVEDGNNIEQVIIGMEKAEELRRTEAGRDKPTMIILYTVKGQGVSFMEGSHAYHGKAPKKDSDDANKAVKEIEARLNELAATLGVAREDLRSYIENWVIKTTQDRFAESRKSAGLERSAEAAPKTGLAPTGKLKVLNPADRVSTRVAFGEKLVEVMAKDEGVIAGSADLAGSFSMGDARKTFPGRFINFPIAEAHMTSFAEGLALAGFIPIIATYEMYTGNQVAPIIHMVRNGVPVLVVGGHSGLSNPGDGSSHQSGEIQSLLDALAADSNSSRLLRMFEPCDAVEARACMDVAMYIVDKERIPVYLRVSRTESPVIDRSSVAKSDEELRRLISQGAYTIYDGRDNTRKKPNAVVIASGTMVAPSIAAAKTLKERGYNVMVINAVSLDKINGKGKIVDLLRGMKDVPIMTICDARPQVLSSKVALAIKEANIKTGPVIPRGIVKYDSGTEAVVYAKNGMDTAGILKTLKEEALPPESELIKAQKEAIAEELPARAKIFATQLMKILSENPTQLYFLGIEDEGPQKAQMMPLYKAVDYIKSLTDSQGRPRFTNLLTKRGSSGELVSEVARLKDDKEINLNLNNVFIGARFLSVNNHAYGEIQGEGRAWISAVDDSRGGDYLPIFEAVTLNMMAYAGMDADFIKSFYDAISDKPIDPGVLQDMLRNRIIYILPKMTKFDTRELRELYERAAEVYRSA